MTTVTHLTSKENPLLKKIRLIQAGARRRPEELVLAEGTRIVKEANQSTYALNAVVFSESFASDERNQTLIRDLRSRKIQLFKVKEKLFGSLSGHQTPQGIVALVKVPPVSLPLKTDMDALVVYACGIQDPGNLGTIIRTAAAAGATLICTSRETVSARNPKVIRSSAGAFFHLTPVEHIDPPVFLNYCRKHAIQLYRTDILNGIPYTESDLKCPCAIVLGNEGSGMMDEEFAEHPGIRIPMARGIESLNVALAGAVILFEASRQRSMK